MPDQSLDGVGELEVYVEEKGNSVDAFIRNGYSAEEVRDHEYLSDNSLRLFLQDLKDKGITGDASDGEEESKSPDKVAIDYELDQDCLPQTH